MNIVHVIPHPSIFESVIKKRADELGHDCFFYTIKTRFGMDRKSIFSLYLRAKKNPQTLFVFHRVPHAVALIISLLVKDFRYALLYWGEDFYSNFISEDDFEKHCLVKSPLLNVTHFERSVSTPSLQWRQTLKTIIALIALNRASGISMGFKQFRFIRSQHFRIFGKKLQTPQFWFQGYSPDNNTISVYPSSFENETYLKVLICHSASSSVAHTQTLDILRAYKAKWNVKINVLGFLSYSGGDEISRDELEQELIAKADFAENIHFERSFLTKEALDQQLQKVDIAVFSCLRDEGITMLTHFVKIGGIVTFNRFSINYDFFKAFSPNKLFTHEDFLRIEPQEIKQKRLQPHTPSLRMLRFEDFDKVGIKNKKINFHTNKN